MFNEVKEIKNPIYNPVNSKVKEKKYPNSLLATQFLSQEREDTSKELSKSEPSLLKKNKFHKKTGSDVPINFQNPLLQIQKLKKDEIRKARSNMNVVPLTRTFSDKKINQSGRTTRKLTSTFGRKSGVLKNPTPESDDKEISVPKKLNDLEIQAHNKRFQEYVIENLAQSKHLAPNKGNLSLMVIRSLALYQKINKQIAINKNDDVKNFYNFMYKTNFIQDLIFNRVIFAYSSMIKYNQERCISTSMNEKVINVFDKFITSFHDFLRKEFVLEKFISLIRVKYVKKDPVIRDFFFNTVFLNLNDYIEVKRVLRNLEGNVKKIFISNVPLIDYNESKESIFVEKNYQFSIDRSVLSNITKESIIRNFYPNNKVIFNKIYINEEKMDFDFKTREQFFKLLIQLCCQNDDKKILKKEVQDLLNIQDKNTSPKSLRMFSAATLECWSIADRKFRELFPGLLLPPFQLKFPQGTEIEIGKKKSNVFSVCQRKNCQIYLRSNPVDPISFSIQGKPLCTLTLEWKIDSIEEEIGMFQEEGELKIKSIIFAKEIPFYEKREILFSLNNPKMINERKFPEL